MTDQPPAQASDEPMLLPPMPKPACLLVGVYAYREDHMQAYAREAVYADRTARAALKAQPAPTEAQGENDDIDGPEPSWKTSDISWILAHLKEHTIFDTVRLKREWDEMRRIALTAQSNTSNNSSSSQPSGNTGELVQGVDVDDLILELGLEKEVAAARVELMAMSDADIEEISQAISARVMVLVKSPGNDVKTSETRMDAETGGAAQNVKSGDIACSSCGLTMEQSRMLAVQGDAVIPASGVQGEPVAEVIETHTGCGGIMAREVKFLDSRARPGDKLYLEVQGEDSARLEFSDITSAVHNDRGTQHTLAIYFKTKAGRDKFHDAFASMVLKDRAAPQPQEQP